MTEFQAHTQTKAEITELADRMVDEAAAIENGEELLKSAARKMSIHDHASKHAIVNAKALIFAGLSTLADVQEFLAA